MDSPDASKILGYGIAVISFSAGVLLLTGLLKLDAPATLRNSFGVVLILMGLYRYVVTHYKPKPSKWRRFTNDSQDD
jgi:hypothetical protein